mmetsp:Transcript_8929/g.14440  ORF Transcript_8929/g.14440 Transcript_8929/m.14440 type:complete len:202 (+) Transcript_8929:641-1246(+)
MIFRAASICLKAVLNLWDRALRTLLKTSFALRPSSFAVLKSSTVSFTISVIVLNASEAFIFGAIPSISWVNFEILPSNFLRNLSSSEALRLILRSSSIVEKSTLPASFLSLTTFESSRWEKCCEEAVESCVADWVLSRRLLRDELTWLPSASCSSSSSISSASSMGNSTSSTLAFWRVSWSFWRNTMRSLSSEFNVLATLL